MYISRALGFVANKAARVQSSTVRLATTQGNKKKRHSNKTSNKLINIKNNNS